MPWSTRKPTALEIAPDWLKPYCEQFLQKLVAQGYAPATMRTYEGAARLLCEAVARRARVLLEVTVEGQPPDQLHRKVGKRR